MHFSLVGYMIFADVWDGFFGLCKGSFSPLRMYILKLISFGSEPGTYLLSIFRIISTKLTVKNANVSPQLSG